MDPLAKYAIIYWTAMLTGLFIAGVTYLVTRSNSSVPRLRGRIADIVFIDPLKRFETYNNVTIVMYDGHSVAFTFGDNHIMLSMNVVQNIHFKDKFSW